MGMTAIKARQNKRHSFRVPVSGIASVRWGKRRSRAYAIDDVSLGGASLRGDPAPERGELVWTRLSIPSSRPIRARGTVVRFTAGWGGCPGFALAFDRVSAEAEDVIHDLGVTLLERAGQHRVMVVGRIHPKREAVTAVVQSAGWDVVEASTPLEAIFALQDPLIDVRWMVVIESLMVAPATELLAFASEAHPGTRRLLIGREHDTLVAMRTLRHGLADACLLYPLRRSRVRRVLGDGPRNWRR